MKLLPFYRWENWEFKWLMNLEVPLISKGKTSPSTYLLPNPHEKMNFRFVNLWGLLKQPVPKMTNRPRGGWLHNDTYPCFSNVNLYQYHPEGCWKHCGLPPRVSVSVGLRWCLRICISNKFSGDAYGSGWHRHPAYLYNMWLSGRAMARSKGPVRAGILRKTPYTFKTPERLPISFDNCLIKVTIC